MDDLRSTWANRVKESQYHQGWHEPDYIGKWPLPKGGQFGSSKETLDSNIFLPDEKMRPYIRETLIEILGAYWTPKYGSDWQNWTRIYLAGSLASYWHSTMDFDTLVGVNTEEFVKIHTDFEGLSDSEICNHLTQEFYTGLDPLVENFAFPPAPNLRLIAKTLDVDSAKIDAIYEMAPSQFFGPMEMTWYCNESSWDIRTIRPYAAYEVITDKWYVHPTKMDKKWGAKSIPWNFWVKTARLADEITASLKGDNSLEDAKRWYELIHSERNQAFGPTGAGILDYRSLQWITFSRWGILGALEKKIHPERPVGHLPPALAKRW
jgi:hypothetical protein